MEAIRSIGDILESDEIEFNETKPTVQKVSGSVRFENVSFPLSRFANARP
ncbi:hypothetical protein [Treponema phagedenis]|nr:hypothetical protein [Treponema phagedenis]